MKKILPYIMITRPLNVVMAGLTILISSAISEYNGPINLIILSALVVVFYTMGANILNDYFDYKIDKINRPDRPIILGLITRNNALIMSIISFIIDCYFDISYENSHIFTGTIHYQNIVTSCIIPTNIF